MGILYGIIVPLEIASYFKESNMSQSSLVTEVFTVAIAGTSSRSLQDELAWNELNIRRKINKLSPFYKIVNKHISPSFAKIGERDIHC